MEVYRLANMERDWVKKGDAVEDVEIKIQTIIILFGLSLLSHNMRKRYTPPYNFLFRVESKTMYLRYLL